MIYSAPVSGLVDTTDVLRKDIATIIREGTLIDEAMVKAQQRVVRRHRQLGIPLAVWQDGRVVEI